MTLSHRENNELAELRSRILELERQVRQIPSRPATPLTDALTEIMHVPAHGRSVGDPVNGDGSPTIYTYQSYRGVVSAVLGPDDIQVTTSGTITGLAAGSPQTLKIFAPYYPFYGPVTGDDDGSWFPNTLSYLENHGDGTGTVLHDRENFPFNAHGSGALPKVDALRWISHLDFGSTPGWYALVNENGNAASGSDFIAGSLFRRAVGNTGSLVITNCGMVRYSGAGPSAGDTLYLADTAGYATAVKPTGSLRVIGRAISSGFTENGIAVVTAQFDFGAVAPAADGLTGLVPLNNGGTGRDMTANPVNGVVYKYDAITLGVTINTGQAGVLTQASSGIPSFLPSSSDNTVLRRVSGGLAWGKVDPANDLSTYVPLAFGGGGRDLTVLNTNGVIFKDSGTTLGATINAGATMGALVQSSSGVPYFLNFDVGNSIDVGSGKIQGMICQKKISTTPPAYDGMVLVYYSSSQTWGALRWVNAKGDIATRDASGPINLPVGTNGQALLADSTQATGLRWGAVSGLPTVSASDEGRMLYVDSSGSWSNSRDVYLGDNPLTASSVQGSFGVVVSSDGDYIKTSSGGLEFFDRSVSSATPLIKIAIGHASLNATGRQLSVKELDVCDASGFAKKMLFLCSDPY